MNWFQLIPLIAKYAPTVIAIIQREGPIIQAMLADFQAIQAGQQPNANPANFIPPTPTSLAAPKGWPTT